MMRSTTTIITIFAGLSGSLNMICAFSFPRALVRSVGTPPDHASKEVLTACPTPTDSHPSGTVTLTRVTGQVVALTTLLFSFAISALAAPPIAIIAEELGYFPVTNKAGDTVYVPKRVQRESSEQAIKLAEKMRSQKIVLAGTYWCSHTSRQKELFGRQAWEKIQYVECSPKGYQANPAFCVAKGIEGYPTWILPGNKQVSGERPLESLAEIVGMTSFRPELESNVPPLPGAACK